MATNEAKKKPNAKGGGGGGGQFALCLLICDYNDWMHVSCSASGFLYVMCVWVTNL